MFQETDPIFEFQGPWGVPVQVSGSIFLLPLVFFAFGTSGAELFYTMAFVAILIGSIFLHEVGHAWGCLIQGVPVRRIVLHGGGGYCEHAWAPSRHEAELIVAMGPIVNLALWAIGGLLWPMTGGGFLTWALWTVSYINLFLAVFNLIPVMPLDGGKLFELTLARFLPDPLPTQIAGAVGLVIAVAWIPLMVFAFLTLGIVLFFFPPLALHWQMLRRAA